MQLRLWEFGNTSVPPFKEMGEVRPYDEQLH